MSWCLQEIIFHLIEGSSVKQLSSNRGIFIWLIAIHQKKRNFLNWLFICKIDWTPPLLYRWHGDNCLSLKNCSDVSIAHRQKSFPNHMFMYVAHCEVSAIRHAEDMAVQIPSHHSIKTGPIQTLASDKCLPFVCKEDPMMSWLPRQYTRISGLFLMHGWNRIPGCEETFHHNSHDHFSLMSSSKFSRISLTFLQMPPTTTSQREDWCLRRIELLWICTSVCPSKCLCVPASPPPACAQTACLQPCLSFCPLQQTPAETENQSLLQSPIICNPKGTQIHTMWPKNRQTSLLTPNLRGDMSWISYCKNFTVTVKSNNIKVHLYWWCHLTKSVTLWASLLCYLRLHKTNGKDNKSLFKSN